MDQVSASVPMCVTRNYSAVEIWQRLRPLLRPHHWRLAGAAVLVAVVGLAVALQPLLAKSAED